MVLRGIAAPLGISDGVVEPATEADAGIAEIATQVETDAGTDDTRIVTPLKLTNFGWITPGTTAKRSFQSRGQDKPNVRDWGAMGDGVNDDRASIRAATNAELDVEFLPGCRYICDGHLSLRTHAHWHGSGVSGDPSAVGPVAPPCIIFTGGDGGGCIRNNNPAANLNHAGLSALVVRVAPDASYSYMLDVMHPTGLRLRDIRLTADTVTSGGTTSNMTCGGIRARVLGSGGQSWVNNWTQVEVKLPQNSTARTVDLDTSDSVILGGNFSGGRGVVVRGPGAVKFIGTRLDISNKGDWDAATNPTGTRGANATIEVNQTEQYFYYFSFLGCQFEEALGRNVLVHVKSLPTTPTLPLRVMANIAHCTFRGSGGNKGLPGDPQPAPVADIELVNDTAEVWQMPKIEGNIHTLVPGGYGVAAHYVYDPAKWTGQPYGGHFPGKPNPTYYIGGEPRQWESTLVHSPTEYTHTAGTTGADVPFVTDTIKGYVLGPNDALRIETDWAHTNSANAKILRVSLNGTVYTGFSATTSAFTRLTTIITANNSYTAQKGGPANYTGAGISTGVVAASTHDMRLDQPLVFSCQVATAGEFVTLLRRHVKLISLPR